MTPGWTSPNVRGYRRASGKAPRDVPYPRASGCAGHPPEQRDLFEYLNAPEGLGVFLFPPSFAQPPIQLDAIHDTANAVKFLYDHPADSKIKARNSQSISRGIGQIRRVLLWNEPSPKDPENGSHATVRERYAQAGLLIEHLHDTSRGPDAFQELVLRMGSLPPSDIGELEDAVQDLRGQSLTLLEQTWLQSVRKR